MITNVAGFAERLCKELEGELLGDFRFHCKDLIFTVAPYGPSEAGAMHVQPSPGGADLDEPAMPGIVVPRGRSLERVAADVRWVLRPRTLLETLVRHLAKRPAGEVAPPEIFDLSRAADDFKNSRRLPGLQPQLEAYVSCREAAYVAALTAAGALDQVDVMMARLKFMGVDPAEADLLRDRPDAKRFWKIYAYAAGYVGAWSPRGRASENKDWCGHIDDAIAAIRRGDEASRRRCVAKANKARGGSNRW